MRFYTRALILLFSALFFNTALASEDIIGKWEGTLAPAPDNELIIDFIINKTDDGSYSVVLNSPDQGAIKNIKANSVVYKSGKLSLGVTDLNGSYEGVLKDGKFEGSWKQEGALIPLNLSPYKKPVLSREDQNVLLGGWHGPFDIPNISLTAVVRFEMVDGKFVGFFDVPEQGVKDYSITDVVLSNGNISFKVPRAEYKGKLANNEIVGRLLQPGRSPIPITLKKGKYKAPTYSLNLPQETRENLSGEWHGHVKTQNSEEHVIFRFETIKKGDFLGFHDNPDRNVKGAMVYEATLTDGKLTLKVSGARLEGKLAGDELIGQFIPGSGSPMDLTLKKE
ncbi:MAG: hypothetical protein PVG39_06625 [Desulfobacteraceae bacterium]